MLEDFFKLGPCTSFITSSWEKPALFDMNRTNILVALNCLRMGVQMVNHELNHLAS